LTKVKGEGYEVEMELVLVNIDEEKRRLTRWNGEWNEFILGGTSLGKY